MTLAEWMQTRAPKAHSTLVGVAAAVGVTPNHVWKWFHKRAVPSAAKMEAIAVLTGGEVMPNDWFPKLHGIGAVRAAAGGGAAAPTWPEAA